MIGTGRSLPDACDQYPPYEPFSAHHADWNGKFEFISRGEPRVITSGVYLTSNLDAST